MNWIHWKSWLLIWLPVLCHVLDEFLPFGVIRGASFVAYIWMVMVFWVFSFTLALHGWNLTVRLVALVFVRARRFALPARRRLQVTFVLIAVLGTSGFFAAERVRVRTIRIPVPALSPALSPLRMVMVSDLHAGRTARRRVLLAARDAIRRAAPDLLVSTGDLLDATDGEAGMYLAFFRDINPPLGKLAVTGNHEVYPGLAASLEALESVGFEVIRNAVVSPVGGIEIGGVDDPAVADFGMARPAEESVLARFSPGTFRILLKHRPELTAAALASCDLQLSGHTHGGQVFPFGLLVRVFYPHPHARLIEFESGLRLYVSNGAGTWGPPLRVLSPAEVTVFVLEHSP